MHSSHLFRDFTIFRRCLFHANKHWDSHDQRKQGILSGMLCLCMQMAVNPKELNCPEKTVPALVHSFPHSSGLNTERPPFLPASSALRLRGLVLLGYANYLTPPFHLKIKLLTQPWLIPAFKSLCECVLLTLCLEKLATTMGNLCYWYWQKPQITILFSFKEIYLPAHHLPELTAFAKHHFNFWSPFSIKI